MDLRKIRRIIWCVLSITAVAIFGQEWILTCNGLFEIFLFEVSAFSLLFRRCRPISLYRSIFCIYDLQLAIYNSLFVFDANSLDLADKFDGIIQYLMQLLVLVRLFVPELLFAQVVRGRMDQCIVYFLHYVFVDELKLRILRR